MKNIKIFTVLILLLGLISCNPEGKKGRIEGEWKLESSDAYYNYLIYLSQQAIPEQVVCADVNYAIRLNFPAQYKRGIRLGFYRPVIHRQEETAPSQRIQNSLE